MKDTLNKWIGQSDQPRICDAFMDGHFDSSM